LDLYLEPWGRKAGFDDVLCSRLALEGGAPTGRLEGGNCFGPEKVARLARALGPLERYELYAYGDSRGDRELLAAAAHPFYKTFPEAA
ncbi:MAG: HAD-IB family phosphatase, partial [Candidatus Methylomirabilis sp.]|nr:HAD-IB family phosphatase [Deltaproteobacteria bacterium]